MAIGLTLLAAGCAAVKQPSAPPPEKKTATVNIDFQTGFIGNWIQVRLGGESVFAGAVTTDNRIGLAAMLRYPVAEAAPLELSVTIDRSKTYPFHVDLKQGRYLGLERNLDNKSIRLNQSREPFLYD
jgi:hypothetical protein